MGFFDKIEAGLSRSRTKFRERMNVMLDRGPDLDEEFWETLEETLILSDIGAPAADSIVENLRDQAVRKALPDAYAVLDLLTDQIADTFTHTEQNIFDENPALILFVGINGSGKTTTVGKLAYEAVEKGRDVLLGSADTFRAAAIEQLEVWAKRAQVEIVTRERGSDPASVCYDTIERAESRNANFVLIDTAGRLHTSDDLMRELEKVVNVVRKRANMPVYTVLVIDATTGQNGMQQAREFNRALDLDGLVVTKLDGTAKGGIAVAISHELELPVLKIGIGEGIEDLRDFDARAFSAALIGAEEVDENGNFTAASDSTDTAEPNQPTHDDRQESSGQPEEPSYDAQEAPESSVAEVATEAPRVDEEASSDSVRSFGGEDVSDEVEEAETTESELSSEGEDASNAEAPSESEESSKEPIATEAPSDDHADVEEPTSDEASSEETKEKASEEEPPKKKYRFRFWKRGN